MANDSPFLFPFLVLVGAVLLARFVAERGLNRLSREHKGLVVEAFSTLRQVNLLVLIALIVVAINAPLAGLGLVIVYFVGVGIYSLRRLRELSIPSSYVQAYCLSLALQVAGFAFYIGMLFGPGR